MEQNILKRYNEIHIMLWEEALKQFMYNTGSCISSLKDILCGTVGEELSIKKMYIVAHLEWGYEQNEV